MKKYRGHYCRICGEIKPNQAFSGSGHKTHICKTCSRLPKIEREAIDHQNEIFGYLRQTNISTKNISRLRHLAESPNNQVSHLAQIVIEVAKVKPARKRRLKELAKKRPDLISELKETGLIMAHYF